MQIINGSAVIDPSEFSGLSAEEHEAIQRRADLTSVTITEYFQGVITDIISGAVQENMAIQLELEKPTFEAFIRADSAVQDQIRTLLGFNVVVPITANLLVDFESGTDGAAVDPAYLIANTKGTLPNNWIWGTVGSPTVSTSQSKPLATPVSVNGVVYPGTGNRSIAWSHTAVSSLRYSYNAPYSDVTFSAWFKCSLPQPDPLSGFYDLIQLANQFSGTSEFAVMQLRDWNLRAHSSQGQGANIPINRDTWYWVTLKNRAGNGAYLNVYNEGLTLVGSSFCPFGANPNGTQIVLFGNVNPHGALQPGFCYFDNIVVGSGVNAIHPLGP